MRNIQGRRRKSTSARQKARERLIRVLLAGCENPARALEIHYWSKEPGLIEIMRGVVMMSEEARGAIEAFIALAGDTRSVTARLDRNGLLTLLSPRAARSVTLAHHAAASDRPGQSRLLN